MVKAKVDSKAARERLELDKVTTISQPTVSV